MMNMILNINSISPIAMKPRITAAILNAFCPFLTPSTEHTNPIMDSTIMAISNTNELLGVNHSNTKNPKVIHVISSENKLNLLVILLQSLLFVCIYRLSYYSP